MRPIHFLPAIAWFSLSLVLLCMPGSNIPKYPWLATIHADKWVHIFLFGVLCFLFDWPLGKGRLEAPKRHTRFLLISIAGIAYGISIEFIQKYWVVGRSFELADIMADSAGCIFAYWIAKWKLAGRTKKNWSR